MPFNGSGVFSILNTFVPNTTILSSAVNANYTDIATGLSDCLTRDGQAGMTAAFKAISGALATPGITFTSDTTSGLYLSASGIIGFVSHSLGMLLNTTIYSVTSATVQAGGSNYAVGDTITETGGTAIIQPVLTVATLSGSAVATVTVTVPGFYTVKPSNPVAQGSTSGVGTSCTLNLTYNDPTSSDYRAVFTDQAGSLLWQKFGASSFVSGLMAKANGLDFATGIGATALATVLGGTFLIRPQGILSPISSTTAPIPTTDSTGVTRIYWTPFNGNVVPIYNGTNFVLYAPSQLTLDTAAGSQAVGGIYDIYMFLNAGTPTLGFSPTWSAGTSGSVTAGSCARGTGAGGAALGVVSGILTNAAAMTLNNASTTYSISANRATYLGSAYINAVAGQINCHRSWGQSRVWGLYNHYQQTDINLLVGDGTASANNNSAAVRPAFNNSANSCTIFTGFAGQTFEVTNTQLLAIAPNPASSVHEFVRNGIGVNSTTVFSGTNGVVGTNAISGGASSQTWNEATVTALHIIQPQLGISTVTAMEQGNSSASVTVLIYGTQPNMCMTTRWIG